MFEPVHGPQVVGTAAISTPARNNNSPLRLIHSPLPTPPLTTAQALAVSSSSRPEDDLSSPLYNRPRRLSPGVGASMGVPPPLGQNGLGAQLGMGAPSGTSSYGDLVALGRPNLLHSRAASYHSPAPPSVPSSNARVKGGLLTSSVSARPLVNHLRRSPEPPRIAPLEDDFPKAPSTSGPSRVAEGRRLSTERPIPGGDIVGRTDTRPTARTSGEIAKGEKQVSSGNPQESEMMLQSSSHHLYSQKEGIYEPHPSSSAIPPTPAHHRRVASANPRADSADTWQPRVVTDVKAPTSYQTPAAPSGGRVLRSGLTHEQFPSRSIAVNRPLPPRAARASTARGRACRVQRTNDQEEDEEEEEEEIPRPAPLSNPADNVADSPNQLQERCDNRDDVQVREDPAGALLDYEDLMFPEVGRGASAIRPAMTSVRRRDPKLTGSGGSSGHSGSTPESGAGFISTVRARATQERLRESQAAGAGARRDSPLLANNEQGQLEAEVRDSRHVPLTEGPRNPAHAHEAPSARRPEPLLPFSQQKENVDPNGPSRRSATVQKASFLNSLASVKVAAPIADARQQRHNAASATVNPAAEEEEEGEHREGDSDDKYSLLMAEEARRQASGLGNLKDAPISNRYSSVKTTNFNGLKFQKLGKAGEGGFSNVYIVRGPMQCVREVLADDGAGGQVAEHQLFDTADEEQALFAMKQVNLKKLDPASQKEVIQEAGLLEDLASCEGNERFILRYFGHRINNNSLKMLLELGGEDISKLLRRGGPLSRADIQNYWRQMVEAVEFIHDKGNIVHTDLKPANFLNVNGRIKLIDFGIAQMIPAHTVHISRDAMVGTPNYMAPEAVKTRDTGQRNKVYKAGKPSDVWSLGCILYQMVYGRPPFDSIKPEKRTATIMDEKHIICFPPTRSGPEEDEEVDQEIIQVMRATLQYDVGKRITIPELLQHPFLTMFLRETVTVSRAKVRELLKRITSAKDQFNEANYVDFADRFFDNLRRQEAEAQE